MCSNGDPPTLYEETYPTARKQHLCCECGSDIDPGEKYQRVKGLWDGDWATFKTCSVCANIRSAAMSELGCAIDFECLYETTGIEFEHAIKTQS